MALYRACTFLSLIVSILTSCAPQIEYKGKGYFGGKSHQFKAVLTPPGSNNVARTFEGLWHTTSSVSSGPGKGKYKKGQTFHDVTTAKEEVTVIGGESSGEMGEFESRKLWGEVAKGIKTGDFDNASKEKTKIEVCVRRLGG